MIKAVLINRERDRAEEVLPLFGRVAPVPGESLLSLITRTAELNVHERIATMLNEAGLGTAKAAYVPFSRVEESARLSKLLSVSIAEVVERMHPRVDSAGPHYVHWYGTPLERRFIEAKRRRLSPMSLLAFRHHRAAWAIRPLTFCAESFETLLDECWHCQKPLGWVTTKGIARCEHCEASLTDLNTTLVTHDLREHAAAAAALVSPFPRIRDQALKRLPRPFSEWEPGHVFAAIVDLGAISANPDRPSNSPVGRRMACGDFQDFDEDQLCAGYWVIATWPESLLDLLDAVTAQRRQTRCDSRALLGQLGRFFDSDAPDTPHGRLLRSEIPTALRRLPIPWRVVRNSSLLGVKRSDTISNFEARGELHVDNRHLGRLKKKGECSLGSYTTRYGTQLFDRQRLSASVSIYKEAVDVVRVVKELGIPPYCIDVFAECSLLRRVTDHDACLLAGKPMFDPKALADLLAKLDALVSVGGTGIAVSVSLQRRFRPAEWVGVFQALLAGELHVVDLDYQAHARSDRLLISRDAVSRLLDRLCADQALPKVDLTGVTTARLLGVNFAFVMEAIRLRLLPAKHVKSNLLAIPLHGVAAFTQEWITTAEIRALFDLRSAKRQRVIDLVGISPDIIINNSPMWRRVSVAKSLTRSTGAFN